MIDCIAPVRRAAAMAPPAEFDDIADALADGTITPAEADALRDQVVLEYCGWTPLIGHDHPGERDVFDAPFLTWAETLAHRTERAAVEDQRRRQRETVQLDLFGSDPDATRYDTPQDHPDFDDIAARFADFAIDEGRWPTSGDIAAGVLRLPTAAVLDECGGFVVVLDTVKIERPVEGAA